MNVAEILKFLKKQGVKNIVCAPGGRCKELLQAFVNDSDFIVTTLYDERSASFFALGLSIESPTVVLTTSGTAVTELSSAMAEAYYQKHSKLIALTADRPLALRGSGAPQSLNQFNVFRNFTNTFIDLTKSTKILIELEVKYPLHLNVCLDEPNPSKVVVSKDRYGSLVVVSELTANEQKLVKENLKEYDGALVLESLSNLRAEDFPKAKVIGYSESFIIKKGLNAFSSIVRLGGVPVFKAWREINEDIDAYYWSEASDFSGGEGVKPFNIIDIFKFFNTKMLSKNLDSEIQKHKDFVRGLIKKYENSEVSFLNRLSKFIAPEDEVFIGNSMPIREWEFVENKNYKIFGQRGVNGIDGSLALALGRMDPKKVNWIILGDLTTMYNFNDFQLLEKFKDRKIRVVVINNYGGQIFKRVIKKDTEYFLNSHNKSFKAIAEFWSLGYLRNDFSVVEDKVLMELTPNKEESDSFWKDLYS